QRRRGPQVSAGGRACCFGAGGGALRGPRTAGGERGRTAATGREARQACAVRVGGDTEARADRRNSSGFRLVDQAPAVRRPPITDRGGFFCRAVGIAFNKSPARCAMSAPCNGGRPRPTDPPT